MNRPPGPKHHYATIQTVKYETTKDPKKPKDTKTSKRKKITNKETTNLCTKIFLSFFLHHKGFKFRLTKNN
jgi:hypothetical protein